MLRPGVRKILIYFDESYDNNHDYLLLGALFNPHPKYLHSEIGAIKRRNKFMLADGTLKEIKYNNCRDPKSYKVCEQAVDAFIKSTSWFRCIVIEESILNLNYFGSMNEPDKLKKARAYKKFAELLLSYNVRDTKNGVLLVDQLKRCYGDRFIEVMKEEFCVPGRNYSRDCSTPTLREILPVDSQVEYYQILQVGDLLLGCVLNNLKPTKNPFKNRIRTYLAKKVEVPGFDKAFWGQFSKKHVELKFPKFNVWYWQPSPSR